MAENVSQSEHVEAGTLPRRFSKRERKVFIWFHRFRGIFVVVAEDEQQARSIAAEQGVTWMANRAVDKVLSPETGEFWLFRLRG